MEYPPELGSCFIWKLSVERPNGRRTIFPRSFNFPENEHRSNALESYQFNGWFNGGKKQSTIRKSGKNKEQSFRKSKKFQHDVYVIYRLNFIINSTRKNNVDHTISSLDTIPIISSFNFSCFILISSGNLCKTMNMILGYQVYCLLKLIAKIIKLLSELISLTKIASLAGCDDLSFSNTIL